jgi:hypothetical protein
MMGLEIPMRDMRLLDSSIPSYETFAQILIRENALVFGMEHVRMIITAEKVRSMQPFPFASKHPNTSAHIRLLLSLLREQQPDLVAVLAFCTPQTTLTPPPVAGAGAGGRRQARAHAAHAPQCRDAGASRERSAH